MKPEARKGEEESGGTEAQPSSREPKVRVMGEEAVSVELTEEENVVLEMLTKQSPIDLNELKAKAGLSNKKWDTAIKGLRKHNLAKVEKTDEGLFVSLV